MIDLPRLVVRAGIRNLMILQRSYFFLQLINVDWIIRCTCRVGRLYYIYTNKKKCVKLLYNFQNYWQLAAIVNWLIVCYSSSHISIIENTRDSWHEYLDNPDGPETNLNSAVFFFFFLSECSPICSHSHEEINQSPIKFT